VVSNWRLFAPAFAVATLIALAGCATSPSAISARTRASSAKRASQIAHTHGTRAGSKSRVQSQVTPPLNTYGGTESQQRALNEAITLLTARCMAKRGFAYPPKGESPGSTTSSILNPDDASSAGNPDATPYGLDEAKDAAEFGYQPPVPFYERPSPSRIGHITVSKPNVAYVQALVGNGGPLEGCSGEAIKSVYANGEPPDPHDLVGTLAAEALAETNGDQRVIRAVANWSSCMRAKGFTYSNPLQPPAVNWQPTYPARPSSLEVSTALADVRCKQNTGMVSVWLKVDAGYERQLIEQNAAALAQVEQATQEMIRRAEKIIVRDS
jgi:hypothetical protein